MRVEIEDAIKYIRYGQLIDDSVQKIDCQVNIRVFTGDHIETAKYIAQRSGILRAEEVDIPGITMLGDEFRAAIGSYSKIWHPEKQ